MAKIFGEAAWKIIRQKVKVIIYEGSNENPTAAVADFVIPSATYAEKEGTFTNFEGRVQRIKKAVEPLANSRPAWKILSDLGSLLGFFPAYQKPEDIFNDLAKENDAFHGLTYKKIGKGGIVWNK